MHIQSYISIITKVKINCRSYDKDQSDSFFVFTSSIIIEENVVIEIFVDFQFSNYLHILEDRDPKNMFIQRTSLCICAHCIIETMHRIEPHFFMGL